MKFKDVELLPGVVIDSEDPKRQGRIKCVVPGLFDDTQMDVNGMPWIYPLTQIGNQGFSKMNVGTKVWVFKTEGNYMEFWYIPMFEMNTVTKSIVENYEEPDVLISRSKGDSSVKLYYDDVTGIQMEIVATSYINIAPDGVITIMNNGPNITIRDKKVFIGASGDTEPAVLGTSLDNALSKLSSNLESVALAASNNPYTTGLFQPLHETSKTLADMIGKKILCKNTEVN